MTYGGLFLDVADEVYAPSDDTYLLADHVTKLRLENAWVLEVGCGAGLISLLAAARGAHVLTTDLNPVATMTTKINARQNKLDHLIDVIRCDLQTAVRSPNRFSYVIFNPPYLPTENVKTSWLEMAWSGGRKGLQTISRFLEMLSQTVGADTQILMTVSSALSQDTFSQQVKRLNLRLENVKERDFFFEKIFLIRLTMKGRKRAGR